jgi:hypothetical protein
MDILEIFLKRQKIRNNAKKEYRRQCVKIAELFEEVNNIANDYKGLGKINAVDKARLDRALVAGKQEMYNENFL